MQDDMQDDMKPLLRSTYGGAGTIGVSRSKFYELIREGKIVPVKIGRRTLVPQAELERYVASLTEARSQA